MSAESRFGPVPTPRPVTADPATRLPERQIVQRSGVRRLWGAARSPRSIHQIPLIDGLAITAVMLLAALILSGWANPMLPWAS